MNRKFKATLAALHREGLAPDPLLDWDALAALASAAEDLTNPAPTRDEAAILAPAVRAGNALLYRPSIGARWFIRERVFAWFRDDDPLLDAATAFVLAHAREPEVLWRCTTRAELVDEAGAWIRGVTATDAELRAAFVEIFGPAPEAKPEATPQAPPRRPTSGVALELIAAEHGIAPEDAVWRRQEAEVDLLIGNLAERKTREAGGTSDPDGARVQSLIRYQKAEAALRAAIRARKNGAGPSPVEQPVRAGGDVDHDRNGKAQDGPGEAGEKEQDNAKASAPEHDLQPAGHDKPGEDKSRLSDGKDAGIHESGREINP